MENIVTAPKTDMFRFRINPEIRKQVEEVYAKNGLTLNLRKVAAKPRVTTVCGGALIENRYALYRCSRRKSP